MSIVITVNAENGADARKELIDLLGLSAQPLTATISSKDLQFTIDRKQSEEPVQEIEVTPEQPAPEEKKKRRTKAEIEADKANTGSEEPPATEVTPEPEVETPAAEVTFPDLPTLQRACAVLVRAGYKEDGIRLVKTVGGADSSKDVPEEKRQELIDALTKFAEEKQIAQ